MSTVLTPNIKRIMRVTEYDLLRIKVSMGNMYMCQDTMKLYYDQGNASTDRVLYNYISVHWHDNSLTIRMKRNALIYYIDRFILKIKLSTQRGQSLLST